MIGYGRNHGGAPKLYGIGALLVALTIIVVIAVTAVSAADVIMVSQRDRKFAPDRLQINRGTVLHIVNDDTVTHHVYVDSPDMKFDSGEQPIGTTVDLKFDRAGTFDVLCAIHPTMHLRVVVR